MGDFLQNLPLLIIIAGIAFGLYVVFATFAEAERRMGREMKLAEIVLTALSMPYSGAYIWLAMPVADRPTPVTTEGGGDV